MPILTVDRAGRKTEIPFEGTPLLSKLLEESGFSQPHPCGGRGVCGKCAIQAGGSLSPMSPAEQRLHTRLSCQTRLLGDCAVVLPQTGEMEQIELDSASVPGPAAGCGHSGPAAAVDIGTTTLALKLFDLGTGKELAAAACLNPQTSVAADVIGRIWSSMNGSRDLLQKQVSDAVRRLLDTACAQAGCRPDEVLKLTVTGNTCMLYLLTGRDPRSLSRAPFEADCLFGCRGVFLGKPVYYPPCMNAFVGADITCAVLSSGQCRSQETSLLADIGTNGEIALRRDGVLYVTSTAAGPAFEGAGIAMGCGSVRGAVDAASAENGALRVHTIGSAPAVGICGSGLIDLIAALLELGKIGETGAMEPKRVDLGNGVFLADRDVRSVQLAKSAIAAGIGTLMHTAGVTPQDVRTLYIAGGFGSHLNVQSAARIGLIPRELAPKARILGNAALAGAALLLDEERIPEAERIASQTRHVNLGGNPEFDDAYMDNMLFPED